MSKETYLNIFKKYELFRSDIYMLTQEKPAEIFFLFEEVCEELVKEKAINRQLPPEFIKNAKLFIGQNTFVNVYFSFIDNRAFFLSDLIDFLALIKAAKKS
ncbi:hypothetical protein [Halarcobacter anaerophilus]|uniref:Uncharacterized protein n=1 Tax=Halarcobacter anaerophilus TaxID=877500 RepID=A0A4Q0Y5C1_9BACT|nr:hypothetical protein [Halarcobacter anaerophilus]QDF27608.1 hypothetical protein AANAER_0095 [Halarcobacter anaerophilus]RXJ63959.1 hypothetical protein CRV06_03175 [Halarcobacter anaerophilus]